MVSRVEVAPLYTLPAASTPRPPAESAVSQVFPELVNCVVEAYVAKVEEAMRESGLPVSQRPVVVAETVWEPYVWLYVKSAPPVPEPQAAAAAERSPEPSVWTHLVEPVPRFETIKLVEEAVPPTVKRASGVVASVPLPMPTLPVVS